MQPAKQNLFSRTGLAPRHRLLFSLVVLACSFSQAQGAPVAATSLSLDQAISEAFRNSPAVQIADSKVREDEGRKWQSYASVLPRLSAGYNQIFSQNDLAQDFPLNGTVIAVPQIQPEYLYNLSLVVPVFDGFANWAKVSAAKQFETATIRDQSWARFRLQREIELQFFRTLSNQILTEVAEQNLTTLTDHLRDVELFRKAGVATTYDVLRVEVQVSESRSEVLSSRDNLEVSRNKLAELMGLEKDPRPLTGNLPPVRVELADKIPRDQFPGRSDLAGLQSRVEALDSQATATSRFWVPSVNLFGNYFYYNNRNFNFPDSQSFRDAYTLGLNLTWNLFDGMNSIGNKRAVAEQKFQAERGLRAATLKAGQDFDLWKRKLAYFGTVYQSRKGDVERSSEAVRLAKAGRKVGARTNSDLLDAESDLFRSRAGVVNAQFGATEALLNLELATGVELLPR